MGGLGDSAGPDHTCRELGVESELQLLAYATATATPDLSGICDLHPSLWQRWILNPLNEARDLNHILRETMSGS